MIPDHMLRIALVFFIYNCVLICGSHVKKYPLLMPNVHPEREQYLCTAAKLVPNETFYIVGFQPNATMNRVHHMLLFGCSAPGTNERYWDCGEMVHSDNNLKKQSPCMSGSNVLYAWARDAKTLTLPKDVGFQVGKETKIQYLVLQVHFAQGLKEGVYDDSGLFLLFTPKPQSKLAAVLLLATGGEIAPKTITNMEVACEINEGKVIHPFAYRTHTHNLGRVVSGYSVKRDVYGEDHWTLLGKRDPLTPQMFYPVFNSKPLGPDMRLAARCTMDSRDLDTVTHIGPTNKDEMCNFYIMYYVEYGKPLETKYCMSDGPPTYHWGRLESLNNIPNEEASTLYDKPNFF